MQDEAVRAIIELFPNTIIVQSKKLADIAMESRPTADRGSVEVGASVGLLIVAIHLLNQMAHNEPEKRLMRAVIDGVVKELPRKISERKVSLESALPIVSQREKAAQHIGAYNTNVLGAFQAIYNSRVEDDIHFINTHSDGPMGDMGGMTVIIGRYLMPEGKTPPGMEISAVILELMGEMAKPSNKPSKKGSGSSKCFVATACFEYPDNPNVLYLREFRDQVLKRSVLGRAFVRLYYKKGPVLAGLIQNRPVCRAVMRKLLSRVVSVIKACRNSQ
jgi:hypothetical protein